MHASYNKYRTYIYSLLGYFHQHDCPTAVVGEARAKWKPPIELRVQDHPVLLKRMIASAKELRALQ